MKNETTTPLLIGLATGLALHVQTEDPEVLEGLTITDAVDAWVAGGRVGGYYFAVDARPSGGYAFWLLADSYPCSDVAAVAATVDRGGRYWLRGGDVLEAAVEAGGCW
jgi:hypothetical protein